MFLRVALLAFGLLRLPLQALELSDTGEVEYLGSNATATVGGSVRLDCGAAPPSIFIWGFTRAGSDGSVALAYDDGQGAKLQVRSGGPGRMHVPADTCALVIEDVHEEAAGTYTCQALYHAGGGAKVVFYFTRLDVHH